MQSAVEWKTYRDPETGVEVRQLTDYKGHSHHLYFTNSGWYEGGRRLVFISDRENRSNFFNIDLRTGAIGQLTELDPDEDTSVLLVSSLNPVRPEIYFWHGRALKALDLTTLKIRTLYPAPAGYVPTITSCTADGQFVCTSLYEDLSARFPVDLLHGYVGFAEYFEARPRSQILRIATAGSRAEVVFEERQWIGHVNTSPTQSHLLTFCHEGPWEKVDQRIWGLDLNAGKAWKIRPKTGEELFGHEFWLADGLHVGYHGWTPQGAIFGTVRYDNAGLRESTFPRGSMHFHSLDNELIVGDGSPTDPYLYLWKRSGDCYEGPRRVCRHRGSFHTQDLHVHPRFSPDGRQILYTSDVQGYGNVYLATTPDFEALPPLPDK